MSDQAEAHSLQLSESELLSLYLLLTRHEAELDQRQQDLLDRIAQEVYGLLSVEEIEHIDSYYNSL